jgi:hypothetical protein
MPDWKNMTKDKFFSQEFNHTQKYWENLLKLIWEFIEIWDRNCQLSFFEYRQRIQEIALSNIRNVTNCELIFHKEDLKMRDGDFFVAIDDDDWLHPNVFKELENYKNSDIVVWNHTILKYNGLIETPPALKLFTNNYAVTSKGMKKIENPPCFPKSEFTFATDAFFPHYDLNRRIVKKEFENNENRFEDIKESFKISHVNKKLNITNKSVASASEMITGNESFVKKVNKFQFFKRLYQVSNQTLSEESFPWASKQIEELNALNSEIKFFKKFYF